MSLDEVWNVYMEKSQLLKENKSTSIKFIFKNLQIQAECVSWRLNISYKKVSTVELFDWCIKSV